MNFIKKAKKAVSICMTLILLFSLVPQTAFATTDGTIYYVDSQNGDDGNDGLSPQTAWKSLDKVNSSVVYGPGVSVLFKKGGIYNGRMKNNDGTWSKGAIVLNAVAGAPGNPIVLGSYGDGDIKPVINGNGATNGILLNNTEYVEVRGLEITNYSTIHAERRGVCIQAKNMGVVNHIYLNDLYIHDILSFDGVLTNSTSQPPVNTVEDGFITEWNGGRSGGVVMLIMPGSTSRSSFEDVRFENLYLERCDRNAVIGPLDFSSFIDEPGGRVKNRNIIWKNIISDYDYGSGIDLCNAADSEISYCLISNSCAKSDKAGVPLQIYACDDTIMQYNEAASCRTIHDGCGYDIDAFNNRCIMQYNYSHDNLMGWLQTCSWYYYASYDCIVRYNISQNDSHMIFRDVGKDFKYYNNFFYIGQKAIDRTTIQHTDRNGSNGYSKDIMFSMSRSDNKAPAYFFNNVFYNDSNTTQTFLEQPGMVYSNNAYYGLYTKIPTTDSKAIVVPKGGDLGVVSAGSGGIGLDTCDGYKLKAGSPLIGKGTRITAITGVPIIRYEDRDFFGNFVEGTPDIGIHQYSATKTVAQLEPLPMVAEESEFRNITVQANGKILGYEGKYGGSAYFNGATYTSMQEMNKNLDITGSFTLEAWVKKPTNAPDQAMQIIDKWGWGSSLTHNQPNDRPRGYMLGLTADNKIDLAFSTVGDNNNNEPARHILSNAAIPEGQWVHVAATYDVTTGKSSIYINGILDKTDSRYSSYSQANRAVTVPGYDIKLRIGCDYDDTKRFTGFMDEVRVYNRALSASALAGHVTSANGIYDSGLYNDTGLLVRYSYGEADNLSAGKTIVHVAPIDMMLTKNISRLPELVRVGYADGTEGVAAVTWSNYDSTTPGIKEVTGTVAGTAIPAAAKVQVRDNSVAVSAAVTVQTMQGDAPILPDSVDVLLKDGTGTKRSVVWDNILPEVYGTIGTFVVHGSFAGSSAKAVANVTVVPKDLALQATGATISANRENWPAIGAIDGNSDPSTRWMVANLKTGDTVTATVAMKESALVDRVFIKQYFDSAWSSYYRIASYHLELLDENNNVVKSVSNALGQGDIDVSFTTPVFARKLRITLTPNSSGIAEGINISQISIFGTPVMNYALTSNGAAIAANKENYPAVNAIDGNNDNRWLIADMNPGDKAIATITMREPVKVANIQINQYYQASWSNPYRISEYTAELLDPADNVVATQSGSFAGGELSISLANTVTASKVRITLTPNAAGLSEGINIAQIAIYGISAQ